MVSLWHRQQRVVDLWLMLVMWIWLFDIALAAIIGSTRFDLGFYAGRMFGLIGASFLLIALLVEMAAMHAGALRAAASAEQRLAEQLARLRSRSEPKPPHVESMESFLSRENIQHYRSLLQSGSLDEAQRRSVEHLLYEEERKQKGDKRADPALSPPLSSKSSG
jgi:two-component system, NarL family, sensor histidine kinase UhpB